MTLNLLVLSLLQQIQAGSIFAFLYNFKIKFVLFCFGFGELVMFVILPKLVRDFFLKKNESMVVRLKDSLP